MFIERIVNIIIHLNDIMISDFLSSIAMRK